MMKYYICLSAIILLICANAQAARVPGALYDKNGKMISNGFAPEDMSREELLKLRSKRLLTKAEGDALAAKNNAIITGNVPGDPPNMPYRFGNKPLPPIKQPVLGPDGLPVNYKPAFGTRGVTRKWGDPNEFPCGTQQHPFAHC